MVVVESCVGDSSVVCAKRKNVKLRGQRKRMTKKACENDIYEVKKKCLFSCIFS